jgi:hypothetical protein
MFCRAPVEFQDEGGWSREYRITLKTEGYEPKSVTLLQSEFDARTLLAAGICGVGTCGLAALYLVPRSRHLADRYGYALRRKEPLPPLPPASGEPEAAPAGGPPVSPPGPGAFEEAPAAGFRY